MGSCDYLCVSRPHVLEQLVTLIHQIETFSCKTLGCQFRSSMVVVLAHQRICSDPAVFNPSYNDFRREANCREELIMFRHPSRVLEGARYETPRLSENVTLV